ncbi:MAG: GAF domain-containing SpoIIE family protein phosphatase [Candidatus Zixiibacteriota bacterium]
MNKNLEEENLRLKSAVEELSILNDIAVAISSTMKVEEINKLIVGKCINSIGVEQGAVTLLKEDQSEPLKTFVRVMDKKPDNIPYRLGMSLTGWMLKNQKPLLINDISSDARFAGISLESGKIKCILSVPLKVKNKMIGHISLFNKKGGDFNQEDLRLLSIIAIQSAQTIESARLYEEERKLADLEEDLKVAHQIQQSLLPKKNPSIEGLDIVGHSIPAKDVGGDYYDFIRIDDTHLGIVIADVSGKGTSAALLMSNLQACLRGQALTNHSVKDTVAKVNFTLCNFMEMGKFITLFYGILDTQNKAFTYTNAGHNYPFLLEGNGNVKTLEKGGLVLGTISNSLYEEETVQLKPGDLILLYTDGITEAANEKNEMFEEKKLLELLKDNQGTSAQEISRRIVDDVLSFQGILPQADDITLVLIKI